MARNLVVCCDGTNNEVAGDATNVLRLYRMLVRDEQQVVFYDGGVGTIPNPDRITRHGRQISLYIDGAMGRTLQRHFLNAYRFLVRHYQPGDHIWLFGFSRGAYTVRAVAAAIHLFGLLRPEVEELSELLWTTYSREGSGSGNLFEAARVFKKAFAVDVSGDPVTRDVPIHCVGVWDTVSAFGMFWDQRTLAHTANNPSISHLRHAMAIDEHRAMFQPNLFRPKSASQHKSMKQVWFAGVHSDVGGGYPEFSKSRPPVQEAALSKVSLEWMLGEVAALDNPLRIDQQSRAHLMNDPEKHPPANPLGMPHESLTRGWSLFELIPQRRFSGKSGGLAWHRPNWFCRRDIAGVRDAQEQPVVPVIHRSVVERLNDTAIKYKPLNLPDQYLIEETAKS